MYIGLNGEYFLTNSDFDYLQNNTWLEKIENWTWSAANTLTDSNSGPNYNELSPKEIYLHEMNRSTKANTIGNWTTPLAKIGLMYASDYALSLGKIEIEQVSKNGIYYGVRLLAGGIKVSTLKTGWMHQSNNDTTKSTDEWIIPYVGHSNDVNGAWLVDSDGYLNEYHATFSYAVRPVFYLNSTEKLNSGSGTTEDPYILEQ